MPIIHVMGDGAAPVLDVSALRLRASMVGAGVCLTPETDIGDSQE